ncbi:hypothetical protein P43SY_001468 [Pythium insidiosum]|uniref:FYVE-type domain-containing protein n=1 Tax=Pythium insidiosum TaxID=114742 RepID=A0AAD5LKT4_PYTIN|nr:hypothetical protein P43SY_001468 [Pythium insidiosum]
MTSIESPPMARPQEQMQQQRRNRVLRSASVCSANLRGFVRRFTGPREHAAASQSAVDDEELRPRDMAADDHDERVSKPTDSPSKRCDLPTEEEEEEEEEETADCEMEPSPPPSTSKRKKQVTILEDAQLSDQLALRRHSHDEVSLLLARPSAEQPAQETRPPARPRQPSEPLPLPVQARAARRSRRSQHTHTHTQASTPRSLELSAEQKRGCFQHIKRRHSVAMAFASVGAVNTSAARENDQQHHHHNSSSRRDHSVVDGSDAGNGSTALLWEPFKSKQGVEVFRSQRSRCEVRGVTRVTASVKNVMALLAADDSSESFAHAQGVLLGRDQVIEARVLASCVPRGASRFFHCGLKYIAMKNPFGTPPLDLVFLDYTDVTTTPDGKLLGYRILESIRVPECRPVPQFVRASLRCEVYVVRETETPGVVEVTFASHLDPKSKYATGKRTTWLDQTIGRLANLRRYAEQTTFSHRVLLDRRDLAQAPTRSACFICDASFGMLQWRRRHNCRLCGDVCCGRCSHKVPVLVGDETTRVRVCLSCMLESRQQQQEPDALVDGAGRDGRRRNSIGNKTFIVYEDNA